MAIAEAIALEDVAAGVGDCVAYGDAPDNAFGISVSSAGDINGDGFDDVVIGAYRASMADDSHGGRGKTYVIFGGLE